ncbi:MAG: phosphatase PAP2 family protein [Gammaproteobacteria bacterium]|nr:phosphatase PAP2 family protein [Gammaproteobacteria bacterium]
MLDWVALHPYWAGIVVFLVAMAESLAIVGLIVPGVVIMFGIGALIAAGAIEFWSAMSWAVAGAITGDGLSFWLGRHYQARLTSIWPFVRYPDTLAQGIAFFEKYGGKSVAFGRFFGPVRAVIPLVAGMMGMPTWRFLVANILSALAWAPAYLLPGMVFGASLELASEVAARLVILMLLIAAILWIVMWIIRKLFTLIHPHTTPMVQSLFRWSRLHPWAGKVASALADPNHPEAKGLSILATLLIVATGLFALVLTAVIEGTALAGFDNTVLQTLQSLRTPWADEFMIKLTWLADALVILTLFLGILSYLLWRGHQRTALYWLSASAFYLAGSTFLKWLLRIPRPDVLAAPLNSYSFPSGHTLFSVLVYGFLAIIIARALSPKWRWIPYVSAGAVVTSVGFSRLYLGVHWFSDILGSVTLGLAWITALGIAYHQHTKIETRWRSLAISALVLLVMAMLTQNWLWKNRDLERYAVSRRVEIVQELDWINKKGEALPIERLDSHGTRNFPINLQFAGPLDLFERSMNTAGWQSSSMLSAENLLKLLSPGLELQQLPVLPKVYDGQHEILALEKNLPGDVRLILRLWPSPVRLLPEGKTLWVGNVSQQHQVKILGLLTFAATTGAGFEKALQTVIRDTSESVMQRLSYDDQVLLLTPRSHQVMPH